MGVGDGTNEAALTRVVLVDDHAIVRSGVRRMLVDSGEYEVVGEAGTADEAVRLARFERPDIVVLDIGLPGRSGLEVVAEIRDLGPRVVMLSMQDEPAYAREAFQRGAQGYVLKEAADEELKAAIRSVLDDQLYVHPGLAKRLILREAEDDLTERERDILRLIALGYTNQEMAARLFLSVRTIEAHRRHILDKLRLKTRADLVRYALERGMVQLGRL